MKNNILKIKGPKGVRIIGAGKPTFIVAEISANHHQKYEEAEQLTSEAAKAGADAVKFQTYTPDTMTIDSDKEWFAVGGKDNPESWQKKTLYQLYQAAYTPWEWQKKLKKLADKLGIIFFSTAFDLTSVDFLESINVPCYKIGSYEATDIPLLKKVAKTKKPVILSVGYASIEEIDDAVKTLRENGCEQLALLHCVTSYAAKANWDALNLRTINDIEKRYDVVAGFSENSAGIESTLRAVGAGASIIEKHFILDRKLGGPDADFSLEPKELAELVSDIRSLERALGQPHYGPADQAENYNKRWRRSLFVVKDIKQGELFTPDNIRVIRPEFGLAPKYFDIIMGMTANQKIERGNPLTWPLVHRQITVRSAKRDDSKTIWQIRNHESIRTASLNSEKINFEQHDKWFEKKYFSVDKNLCNVIVINDHILGYCRLDEIEQGYRISIAINADFHGQGLGDMLLKTVLSDYPVHKTINAEIKKNNTASLHLFEKNGFTMKSDDDANFYLTR